jgi:FeS assembly SUF system regulator
MIRVTKLADYGVLLMTWFAWRHGAPGAALRTALALAGETGLPAPTVSKLLRLLAKAGLLASQRGANGGYSLARTPEEISMAEIITAIEGPIALMECLSDDTPECEVEPLCPTRTNWNRINHAIRTALEGISLAEMARPQRGWQERMSRSLAGTENPR